MQSYTNVDAYIKKAEPVHQTLLQQVRTIVRATAKEAVEGIAYGMPAYTLSGKPLFYFASMKGHLGIYPTPGPIKTMKDELQKFSTSKGCVRLSYANKIPKTLLVKLLKARMKEIQNEIR